MGGLLTVESLEPRIALATLVNPTTLTYTDIDGDKVTVTASIGAFSFANPPNGTAFVDTFFFTPANAIGGQQLLFVDLGKGSGFQGADLTVSVVKAGAGDGLAAVGLILADGIDLGKVTVEGDLGEIDCGDANTATPGLEALNVRSMGRYGEVTDPLSAGLISDIHGALGALRVGEDVKDAGIIVTADVNADATIGSITIGGSLIGGAATSSGSISAESDIGPVKIGHDLIGGDGTLSGRLIAEGKMGAVTIGGSVVGGSGTLSGQVGSNGGMGAVKIRGNLIGGGGISAGQIFTADGSKMGAVTIGGSLLGGAGSNSGELFSDGEMGAVKIAHDVKGGGGDESGKIDAGGKLGAVTIGGSLLGGGGEDSGRVEGGTGIGALKIGHDVKGGADGSGSVFTVATLASITIGGSLVGGIGSSSGLIFADDGIGPVKIGHDIIGGIETNTGNIFTNGSLGSVTVGGSLVGGSGGQNSGIIYSSGTMGAVKIGHDVLGGAGDNSGTIEGDGGIASLTIGGSLVGGTASFTGAVFSFGDIGPVKIGHDLVGGSHSGIGISPDITDSGSIESNHRIVSVSIGGSIIAGTDDSVGGRLIKNAAIVAGEDIGSLTVKGSVIGNAGRQGETLVLISALGRATPGATTDLAIGKVTIGKRVEFVRIQAGYDNDLIPNNADAQIGKVSVGGDWIASSIIAGAVNLGNDDLPGGAGADADNVRFGDIHDFKIDELVATGQPDSATIISRIGSISITGQVFGTPGSFSGLDGFGFVAEQIGAVKVGGGTFQLDAATGNDGIFIGRTGDTTLHEIDASFVTLPLPAASATLVNASTVTFEDTDGDRVTVKLSKPLLTAANVNAVFQFDTGTVGDGIAARQQLRVLDLKPLATDGLGVTITVKPGGGDRVANVGHIDSTGFDLGAVTIPGDLGQIDAGAATPGVPGVKTLSVRTLGRLGLDTQEDTLFPSLVSDFNGGLDTLRVKQDITGATINVTGSIGSVNIGGSLIGGDTTGSGAIVTSQAIGTVKIRQHLHGGAGIGSGRIDSGTSIASLTVGGSLIGGDINADGTTLGAVKIGHNVLGGARDFSGRLAGNTSVGSVTVAGSWLGGSGPSSGQIFTAAGNIGVVRIGHNFVGGGGDESGKIDSAGGLTSLSVRGSLIGGSGDQDTFTSGGILHDGQVFAAGGIGAVKIGHDVIGAVGDSSGRIAANLDLARVIIGGSLLGGKTPGSATIFADGELGGVKVAHDVIGGPGGGGEIGASIGLGTIAISGSLVGGTGGGGVLLSNGDMGAVKIGHDFSGGGGASAGQISSLGRLASLAIGGSLVGDASDLGSFGVGTGLIRGAGIGAVKIGRDLIGGSIGGTATGVGSAGYIESSKSIASVTIGGSIIAGIDDSTGGALTKNASIRAGDDIGSLDVKGSLIGNVAPNGASLVIISARGQAVPVGDNEVAIGKITIGGRVERANILTGYSVELAPANDGVQIGSVKVGRDWIASNLVAGVQNFGADDATGGTGANADNVNFGDTHDTFIGLGSLTNRIAEIIIGGIVVGSALPGSDHFGFSASEIGSFKSLGFTAALTAGASGDRIQLSPITGDVTLREI